MKTIINKFTFITTTLFVIFFTIVSPSYAQTDNINQENINIEPPKEEIVEGVVISIKETGQETAFDQLAPYQILEVQFTNSERTGQSVEVKNSSAFADITAQYEDYKVNDKLKIYSGKDFENNDVYVVAGRIKRHGLTVLTILFILAVLIIGRIWGAMSLIGLALSFGVIFRIIIPMIIKGYDPVIAALIGSMIIIPSTFYVSHGINKKTHVGVISTLIALSFTGFLAVYFVDKVHLTGFASEEAGFLQIERQGTIDIKGLLLAGIIIGTLGILDDVTIGQASVVKQIKHAKPSIKFWTLFKKGMEVGQDHIASMVNTLILVYAGSSLPLLLLFFDSQKTFIDIIEFEVIAEEIVKMLVGSIGLILAAPLATLIAAYVFTKYHDDTKKTAHKERSFHSH
ncbi:MAG: YibE/F family protein [Candidatus Pacebacteria bacterium]|nr:YibE/F family protein [Candidatus Paceibacterota bacterium]